MKFLALVAMVAAVSARPEVIVRQPSGDKSMESKDESDMWDMMKGETTPMGAVTVGALATSTAVAVSALYM